MSPMLLQDLNDKNSYAVNTQAQYSCVNESYRIEGEDISTCMHSGQWSKPPQCVEEELD